MTMTTKRLASLMCPSHANLMGNVHGGTILQLLEQAGRFATKAYSRGPTAVVAASRTEFRKPMHVGEVASVEATVDYTGEHVMRVSMKVHAEDMTTGIKRLTNTAKMWFSTIDVVRIDGEIRACAKVGSRLLPPLEPSCIATDAIGEHEVSSKERKAVPLHTRDEEEFPIVLQQVPDPDAVASHPFISAGHILRIMDTGASLAAISHSRHQCVTVLLDKVCFSTPVQLGDLCTIRAGVTYTSERSMEVVAQVWKSPSGIVGGLPDDSISLQTVCAVEARFVFVALDNSSGKVLNVPSLPKEKQLTRRWAYGACKHKERTKERKSRL